MPNSTNMAKVMKITYRTAKTAPTLFLRVNFPMNKTIHRQDTATSREPMTKSMPLELIYTTASSPWPSSVRVLMSQGNPNANRIAREFAPKAFETPIPPSPEIKQHIKNHLIVKLATKKIFLLKWCIQSNV